MVYTAVILNELLWRIARTNIRVVRGSVPIIKVRTCEKPIIGSLDTFCNVISDVNA